MQTDPDEPRPHPEESPAIFRSTRWSVVLSAGGGEDSGSRRALETLCATYWYPLYAFARRRGSGTEEARDLVQGYFARLIEKRDLAAADPQRGRFRAFLLTSFKHFVANDRDRAQALKRGGAAKHVSLDMEGAGARYEAADERLSPERLFERAWALALLDEVLEKLRGDYEKRGRAELFEAIKGCLTDPDGLGEYDGIAQELGMSPGALKVAVHRVRERYREALLAEVKSTLADPSESQDELGHLLSALGG